MKLNDSGYFTLHEWFDKCLHLSVPPKVVITDEHGQTMQDVIGPYDEGSSVPLFCEASDGKDKYYI